MPCAAFSPDGGKENEGKTCLNCGWYFAWFGVCFNGDSEWCADCPPYPDKGCCREWKEIKSDVCV